MNLSNNIRKSTWVKIVVGLALAVGTLGATTGCDEDLIGSGFRFGNFNQGVPLKMDCRKNPYDPRC